MTGILKGSGGCLNSIVAASDLQPKRNRLFSKQPDEVKYFIVVLSVGSNKQDNLLPGKHDPHYVD